MTLKRLDNVGIVGQVVGDSIIGSTLNGDSESSPGAMGCGNRFNGSLIVTREG